MITRTAKIYANALTDSDSTKSLKELELVMETFTSNTDLENVLLTPTISIEQKTEVLNDIFKNDLSERIMNFLKILIEKKHINELKAIIEALKDNIDAENGIKKVTVISAIELNNEIKNEITEILGKKLNKEINANWQIDEGIIAGLIVKIDDNVIDTSIKTKLDKIKGSV